MLNLKKNFIIFFLILKILDRNLILIITKINQINLAKYCKNWNILLPIKNKIFYQLI